MVDELGNGKDLEVWFALRHLEERFAALEQFRPVRSGRPELWGDYEEARLKLGEPMEELRRALSEALPDTTPDPATGSAAHVFAAIISHYDERELAQRSAEAGPPPGGLFQTKLCGLYDGGERFFSYLDAALREPNTSPLVLELFLFCMKSGFCGRYAEPSDPERAARDDELCRRVGVGAPERPPSPPPKKPLGRIDGVGFPYRYYLAAALAILGFWVTLNEVAESHQARKRGLVSCDGVSER